MTQEQVNEIINYFEERIDIEEMCKELNITEKEYCQFIVNLIESYPAKKGVRICFCQEGNK